MHACVRTYAHAFIRAEGDEALGSACTKYDAGAEITSHLPPPTSHLPPPTSHPSQATDASRVIELEALREELGSAEIQHAQLMQELTAAC